MPLNIDELVELLGSGSVAVDLDKRRAYSYDEVLPQFYEREYLADVVCFPETTEQVASLLRYANERRIAVTPRGAGTGLSGGAVPAHGGIVLSLERMNRILEVDVANRTVTAEPGVVTAEISRAAAAGGLYYAGDPCSGDASFIGGNVAENAGGNKVLKYGSTGAHVLGLEAVLADGSIVEFGGKRRKDVTGYDFVHLLVGSEGTLAVITKVILSLLPAPRATMDLLVPMPDVERAMALVPRIAQDCSVLPAAIEYMDGETIRLVERYLNTKLPKSGADAYLIIELEGRDGELLWQEAESVGDLCLTCGALEVYVAEDRNARERLWRARKLAAEAVWAAAGVQLSNEDVVVPSGAIGSLMSGLAAITERHGVRQASYGHVGDGNIHITFYRDEAGDGLEGLGHALRLDLYELVLRLGGTLTGEHGVGLKRAAYSPLFLSEAARQLIRSVKAAFDPNGILNPGKILP